MLGILGYDNIHGTPAKVTTSGKEDQGAKPYQQLESDSQAFEAEKKRQFLTPRITALSTFIESEGRIRNLIDLYPETTEISDVQSARDLIGQYQTGLEEVNTSQAAKRANEAHFPNS